MSQTQLLLAHHKQGSHMSKCQKHRCLLQRVECQTEVSIGPVMVQLWREKAQSCLPKDSPVWRSLLLMLKQCKLTEQDPPPPLRPSLTHGGIPPLSVPHLLYHTILFLPLSTLHQQPSNPLLQAPKSSLRPNQNLKQPQSTSTP